jgi:hypothetical protein
MTELTFSWNDPRQLVVQLFHLKHVLVNDAVQTVSYYRMR